MHYSNTSQTIHWKQAIFSDLGVLLNIAFHLRKTE